MLAPFIEEEIWKKEVWCYDTFQLPAVLLPAVLLVEDNAKTCAHTMSLLNKITICKYNEVVKNEHV